MLHYMLDAELFLRPQRSTYREDSLKPSVQTTTSRFVRRGKRGTRVWLRPRLHWYSKWVSYLYH